MLDLLASFATLAFIGAGYTRPTFSSSVSDYIQPDASLVAADRFHILIQLTPRGYLLAGTADNVLHHFAECTVLVRDYTMHIYRVLRLSKVDVRVSCY